MLISQAYQNRKEYLEENEYTFLYNLDDIEKRNREIVERHTAQSSF